MGKNRRKDEEKEKAERRRALRQETTRSVVGVLFVIVAIVLLLSAAHRAGPFGEYLYQGVSYVFGIGYFMLPVLLIFGSISFFKQQTERPGIVRSIGLVLMLLSFLGLIELVMEGEGGIVGKLISMPLMASVDVIASSVLLVGVFIIAILVTFDTELHLGIFTRLQTLVLKKKDGAVQTASVDPKVTSFVAEEAEEVYDEIDHTGDEEEVPDSPIEREIPRPVLFDAPKPTTEPEGLAFLPIDYISPPLSLLERDKGKPAVGDTKANANIIKRTLQNFGITVEMDEIVVGPTVTRYALKPAEGVRLSKILSLQSNLELALAAAPLRIEAPIPGKSLVGIEVPNAAKATLGLSSLLGSPEFTDSPKPLLVTLGRDITGTPLYADIAKMPHAIIAGATGAGKSVTIHAIVTSLLYRNGPESLRMIMIDPKRVELSLYKGIPHLITPVITDAKKAILALRWAIKEMERRYRVFEDVSVRDLSSYHQNVLAPALKKLGPDVSSTEDESGKERPEQMPHIVVIIDELADIMQAYPRELEAAIVRLAQMSRATGIHLLLATQRPSVNVITGLIKANVPTRIALQVASQIDSRTILDSAGAEKLLGKGDMLFLASDMAKPKRLQSAFISENEVKKIVQFLTKNNEYGLNQIDLGGESEGGSDNMGGNDFDDDEDPLYEDARSEIIKAGKASTSLLQRRLRVGYSRAARLMDLLEHRAVIGPSDGTNKPRDVLIKDSGGHNDVPANEDDGAYV